MGYTTCGIHTRRRCCWRCDRCPSCSLSTGRLLRGDYCRRCTDELKAAGYVWSDYYKNYVTPAEARAAKAARVEARLAEIIGNERAQAEMRGLFD